MEGGELSVIGEEPGEEAAEILFAKRRFCFCFHYKSGGPHWWRKVGLSSENRPDVTFWSRGVGALRKLREWSEIVAGPRWKTFIRRFGRKCGGGGGGGGGGYNWQASRFHYDPLDYALNFDEGPMKADDSAVEDPDYLNRNFSSRYAQSAKASVDFGKDGPNFV